MRPSSCAMRGILAARGRTRRPPALLLLVGLVILSDTARIGVLHDVRCVFVGDESLEWRGRTLVCARCRSSSFLSVRQRWLRYKGPPVGSWHSATTALHRRAAKYGGCVLFGTNGTRSLVRSGGLGTVVLSAVMPMLCYNNMRNHISSLRKYVWTAFAQTCNTDRLPFLPLQRIERIICRNSCLHACSRLCIHST